MKLLLCIDTDNVLSNAKVSGGGDAMTMKSLIQFIVTSLMEKLKSYFPAGFDVAFITFTADQINLNVRL